MKRLPLEPVLPSPIPSFLSDRFILLGLAIFGLLGSIYLIQKCKITNPAVFVQNNEGTLYSNLAGTNIMAFQEEPKLQLHGPLEEKSQIQFELHKSIQSKKYLVDFGNGERRIFNNRNFTYAYQEAGNYKLQLMEMKDERLRMVESRHILICKNSLYR